MLGASRLALCYCYLINIVWVIYFPRHVQSSLDEEKLIKSLFKGYNKLIRPVKNSSEFVIITMDLVLLQLINVVSSLLTRACLTLNSS
jgi:hypothetical protein